MNKDINIADIIVHLHPESSCDNSSIENELRSHDGVISVHFDTDNHPHSVIVAYNTDAVTSEVLLNGIRKCDSRAVMAGI